ncbi:protein roadkill-like [Microplitis mediator]|uniref:protein roadkill-like n=1 Tax=Microplitis mediator TaxID=375433 RepID=UPI002555C215|nr:protein roadkill-like [Microplitis mediator]
MQLKKIERNVHTEYETWELKNINEIFSKVKPNAKLNEAVPVIYKFVKEFDSHPIEWYVKLMFRRKKLKGGFIMDFDAVEKLAPKNHVTCNIYLVDADENKFFLGRKNRRSDSTLFYYPGVTLGAFCGYNQLPNTIDKLLPNDTMTLLIELNTYLDDNFIFPYEFIQCSIEQDSNLSDDFLKLYKFRNEGELMIYVQSVEFPVHKTVLETRCPKLYDVVARHQQTSDSNNNQLALTDIKPEIFERVLEFIYTGKVKDLDDHAEDLLEAASKYELIKLKNLCEFSLIENYLTWENHYEIRELANRLNASELLMNTYLLENISNASLMNFYCTLSGTLISTKLDGSKNVTKNYFRNGIPKGIRIVEEEMALHQPSQI